MGTISCAILKILINFEGGESEEEGEGSSNLLDCLVQVQKPRVAATC